MVEINLLPWRENQRSREKKTFILLLLSALLLAMSFIFLTNYQVKALMAYQSRENQQLQAEIVALNGELQDIKKLKLLKNELIMQLTRLQQFQLSNVLTIHLLDDLANLIPEDVYLQQVNMQQNKVILVGFSSKDRQIHLLIHNAEKSPWIDKPELAEIKKNKEGKKHKFNEFKLNFTLKYKDK